MKGILWGESYESAGRRLIWRHGGVAEFRAAGGEQTSRRVPKVGGMVVQDMASEGCVFTGEGICQPCQRRAREVEASDINNR